LSDGRKAYNVAVGLVAAAILTVLCWPLLHEYGPAAAPQPVANASTARLVARQVPRQHSELDITLTREGVNVVNLTGTLLDTCSVTIAGGYVQMIDSLAASQAVVVH